MTAGKKYGGLKGEKIQRLKVREQENARLKRVVTDLTLDKLFLNWAVEENWKEENKAPFLIRTNDS